MKNLPFYFLCAVTLLLPTPVLRAQEDGGQGDAGELPVLSQMRVPSAKDLLEQVEPIDWLVLKKDSSGEQPVIEAESVPDRPNTLEKYKAENKKRLDIFLPGGTSPEVNLPVSAIDRIIYAQDLMLERVKLLLRDATPENIETAFELVMLVERRLPKWSKTGPRLQTLLFQDAQQKLARQEQELALALLEECHQLPGVYDGLEPLPDVTRQVGEIIEDLVSKAVAKEDFQKAQHFIRRVGETFPQHPVRQRWLTKLEQMAQVHYDAARQNFEQKNYPAAAASIQAGVRIWRPQGDNAAIYRQVLTRYQQLFVGVVSLGQKFPVTTSVAKRHKELQDAKLFEPYRAENVVYYNTDIFEQWDPLDLGRRVVFTLKKQQPYSSGLPQITSPNIVDTLKARLDPANKAYNERFASYIKEFLVSSPHEFEVRFSRIPLRVEALFSFPATTPDGEVYSRRFEKASQDDKKISFARRLPEPEGVVDYHIAEVIEKKFKNSSQAIQAMQRGEIQMIPHLQPWEIDSFETGKDFYRRQYAQPFVHVIQLNPQTEILKNTQVRRALSKSIDRERILKRVILQDAAMRHGRVVAAPWPSQSYANSSLVEAPNYSLAGLREAAALRGTAEMVLKADKKEGEAEDGPRTKELPTLRLVLEDDPVITRATGQILKFWSTAGFKVEVVPTTDDPNAWDMVYHKLKMTEPLTDIWPFLTLSDEATVDGLLVLPDWLKQKLIDLDFTGNFPAAEADLRLLHRHLSAQGFFIPLWEIDDYAVFSTSISGFPQTPVSPYQNVTSWTVKP